MKQPTVVKQSVVVAAVALLCMAAPARSEPSPQYDKCMGDVDHGIMIISQIAKCASDEVGRQDVTLNAEYRKLRASLSSRQQESLLKAQRAWLKFREDWCRFEEVSNSAPGGLANYYLCLLEVTDRQIEAFKTHH